jgi:hypothetical protein
VTAGQTDTKVKKVSYKFDIVFTFVFFSICVVEQFLLRYLEYKGGLVNQPWWFFLPALCFMLLFFLILLFCLVRFFIRIFSPPRNLKHTLLKISFAAAPAIILIGSWFLTGPLSPVFLRGFEKWVQKEVDVKAIQEWLKTEGNKYQGKYYFSDDYFPKEFPICLTASKPQIISFDISEIDGSLYIELVYGGGMDHWGVRIGPPSMKMPKEGMIKIRESYYEFRRPIAPGAYIFEGG